MAADPEITPGELEDLGLFDPAAPDAGARLELLGYLVSLGATSDDLTAYRDELPGLASVLAIRGGAGLTLETLAEKAELHPNFLGRVERGEEYISLSALLRLARALKIRVRDLVDALLDTVGKYRQIVASKIPEI